MAERGAAWRPMDRLERMYHKQVQTYLSTRTCPQKCAAIFASCFLSEDGMVFPCSIWNAPLGNIREHGYSLLGPLRSRQAQELRTKLLAKDCPNCWTPCEAYQTLLANLLRC